MHVLVADDSGVIRKIIVRALNSLGVKDVVEAADGDEAIAKFGSASFDLVLTDWNMPGKSGLDVLKAIPVIMVTTEAEKSRVMEAIQAGVSDYLTKPFEAADLQAKIDKFVSCNA
jgi:two-component system chemotaxis response regulator CheY